MVDISSLDILIVDKFSLDILIVDIFSLNVDIHHLGTALGLRQLLTALPSCPVPH